MLYLAALMIPFQVTMIPNFILIRQLRWYNSYQALILPAAFSAFSTFLLRQYYRGIPMDLDEAARMDGASSWRIWWQVIVPLSGPVLATLAIFNFQLTWNDFLWPLVITNTDSMRTIPVGLSSFQGQYSTEWHLLMAGSVIALDVMRGALEQKPARITSYSTPPNRAALPKSSPHPDGKRLPVAGCSAPVYLAP
jgi:multiple sugar transport system permease protein